MSHHTQLFRIAAIILFGALGLQGLWAASEQLTISDTVGKMLQTIGLVAYGTSGIWIAIRVLLKKSRQRAMDGLWSIGVVLATGLAPPVWGGAPIFAGVMSGAAGAAIVALSLWLLRRDAMSSATINTPNNEN